MGVLIHINVKMGCDCPYSAKEENPSSLRKDASVHKGNSGVVNFASSTLFMSTE